MENGLLFMTEKEVMQRLAAGYKGFHQKLGGFSTGSGFALGVEYRRQEMGRHLDLRVAGQASFKSYQKYQLQLSLPRLANEHVFADFTATQRNFPQEDFFGLGPDSIVDDRTNFNLEDTRFTGTLGFRPLPWLSIGGQGAVLLTNTGPGTDPRYPSTEDLFAASTTPALDEQPDYFVSSAFIGIDYRDNPFNPRSGGDYLVHWTHFDDRDLGRYTFRRLDIELTQYVSFFNKRRVIAFRAKTSLDDTGPGQEVPFFLQQTLGGSDDLRGFREFRFRDRNQLLFNLEYRWEAFSGLDMAVFGDAGKVFDDRRDFDLSDMETAWGVGARFNSRNGVFLRIDAGFGNEGHRLFIKFGRTFLRRNEQLLFLKPTPP